MDLYYMILTFKAVILVIKNQKEKIINVKYHKLYVKS